ncbi:MAG: carbon-nitrogen hydrolase family protein [Clostridiales bacterium]|nr:carbon-nitrogen hydrolase family protein [Clostridiales bacterium]
MLVTDNKNENLYKAEKMIRQAAKEGSELIVLPEMFNCPYENDFFPVFAEKFPGKSTQVLSDLAKELKIYIIGGSIPEFDNGKIFNTSYVFDREGVLIGKHRKIHLFDIDIENGISFKESDTLSKGDKVTVVDTEYCKIGIAICYDMRFPELMRLMVQQGAEMIIIPAAFNMTTGPAHWDLTLRARALDNQVYFAAVSPARNLQASYHAYGHSALADPWGKIIAQGNEKEDIIYGEVDLDHIKKIRNQLPLLKHRRSDLYELVKY